MDDAGNLSFRETGVVSIVPPFGFYNCGNIGDKALIFRVNGRDPRRWPQDENRMIHLSLQGQHSPAYWKGSECCHEKDSLSITV